MAITKKKYIVGQKITVLPEAPSLDGYEFLGWFTAKEGGEQVTAGHIITETLKLYARWKPAYSEDLNSESNNNPKEFLNYSDDGLITGLVTGKDVDVSLIDCYATGVGDNAFKGNTSIESIFIPYAKTIGNSAFENCTGLSNIEFCDELTSIGDSAFKGCSNISSIYIGNYITSIGQNAFEGCTSISDIVIPFDVTSIGADAFKGCTSLTAIRAYGFNMDSAKTIFTNIPKTCKIYCSDGIVLDDTKTEYAQLDEFKYNATTGANTGNTSGSNPTGDIVDGYAKSLVNRNWSAISRSGITGIDLPNITTSGTYSLRSLTALGRVIMNGNVAQQMFDGDSELTRAYVKSGEQILSHAFRNCTKLRSIYFPKQCTKILQYGFYNCAKLLTITLPSTLTEIQQYSFNSCVNLQKIIGLKDTNITGIGQYAFAACSSLKYVELPDTLNSLGTYVFFQCSNIKSVKYSKILTIIPSYTFAQCSRLENISDLDGVTRVVGQAFQQCCSLKEITFPQNSTKLTLDANAFIGCDSLTTFTCNAPDIVFAASCFKGCDKLMTVNIKNKTATNTYTTTIDTWGLPKDAKIYFANGVILSPTAVPK